MLLEPGARVAVVGAGPGGLVAAKNALEAGFDVTVFEAADDLGGQWHTAGSQSGIWPGMRTNTSRMMTAFSDFPAPGDRALYPLAPEIHAYLRAYADAFGVSDRIRFGRRVVSVEPAWLVNGEPFDAVVIASGRFQAPAVPTGLRGFAGELLHSFDYPGAESFRGRRVLVYGNGVSGHEIASDIATVTPVISAYRKPRYVLQKVVDGVPSDWRWYTYVGALRRRALPPGEWARDLRERIVRVSGHPADYGAPAPDDDLLVAGHSLCQDYLAQVRDRRISCRPAVAAVHDRTVAFTDGTEETVDVIVCATGYALSIPYLAPEVWAATGPHLALYQRTFHPDLPRFAVVGQYALQGPYFPVLELQARWVAGVWSGRMPAPPVAAMRDRVTAPPAAESHNVLAVDLAEQAGIAPRLDDHPDLAEGLLFGPMLPPRYRLDGPGATADAAEVFRTQLASSPRAPIHPDDVRMLPALGLDLAASSAARDFPPTARHEGSRTPPTVLTEGRP